MDINFNEEVIDFKEKEKVIISKQQRNGRKCWTLIENFIDNLDDKADAKKFVKFVKKNQCCNGSIQENSVIQFQGDCIGFLKEALINKYDYDESDIIVKGI